MKLKLKLSGRLIRLAAGPVPDGSPPEDYYLNQTFELLLARAQTAQKGDRKIYRLACREPVKLLKTVTSRSVSLGSKI